MPALRVPYVALIVALPTALVGCGSPKRDVPTALATPGAVAAARPTVFPAPTKSAPPVTATPTATTPVTAAPPPTGPATIGVDEAGGRFAFSPQDVTLKAGADGNVTFVADNTGAAPHTWESKALGFDTKNVDAGKQVTVTFSAKPGTYDYVCLYHESLGMVGKITVA